MSNNKFVFLGHVDSGKSSLVGHIIRLCNGDDGERAFREAAVTSFPHALVSMVNPLPVERYRGVTIEHHTVLVRYGGRSSASPKVELVLIDAPGHRSYLHHTLKVLAVSNIAVLVVAAREGEYEAGVQVAHQRLAQAVLLGIRRLIVVVNKLDARSLWFSGRVLTDHEWYQKTVDEVSAFLHRLAIPVDVTFVPCSALLGTNIMARDPDMWTWYSGPTVLDLLASCCPSSSSCASPPPPSSSLSLSSPSPPRPAVSCFQKSESQLCILVTRVCYVRSQYIVCGAVVSGRVCVGDSVAHLGPLRRRCRMGIAPRHRHHVPATLPSVMKIKTMQRHRVDITSADTGHLVGLAFSPPTIAQWLRSGSVLVSAPLGRPRFDSLRVVLPAVSVPPPARALLHPLPLARRLDSFRATVCVWSGYRLCSLENSILRIHIGTARAHVRVVRVLSARDGSRPELTQNRKEGDVVLQLLFAPVVISEVASLACAKREKLARFLLLAGPELVGAGIVCVAYCWCVLRIVRLLQSGRAVPKHSAGSGSPYVELVRRVALLPEDIMRIIVLLL
eukprot:gnl/Spiro4/2653_TR1284_c0_g1_i1.p1 gnl/Spiro4/2653_TR1284_c0_g1~~gnl/Spiro4/2653_TR1284_c0_g1_i1.p1  ORF type:complete len:560 (-),score=114.41 gnl/Spiro4/2653_TR1284_c0_g1_i1:12-1691(-)